MTVIQYTQYAAKAIYAGVVVFLGALLAALQAAPDVSIGNLSTASWITIVLATVIAVGGVFGLSNKAMPGGS